MKKLLTLTLLSFALSGCFSSSSSSDKPAPLTERSYVIQTASASWNDGAAVVTGNILGDRTVQSSILETQKTDYTISTYNNILYQVGKYGIDELALYSSDDLSTPEWKISANDDGEALANPYQVVQISDDKAYVVRYGSSNLWVINPKETSTDKIITKRIDLSAYNLEEANVPYMSNAVYNNGKLYVLMQRLDQFFSVVDSSYIAVIDTDTDTEIDIAQDGSALKGIKLNADNVADISLHNDILYVAGRGNFDNNSGALDKVDLTTNTVTQITDGTPFQGLKFDYKDFDYTTEEMVDAIAYPHIVDVAVVDNNNGYLLVRAETNYAMSGSSYIYPFNPSTGEIEEKSLDIPELKDQLVSDITLDPNGKLWMAITDAADPQVLVYDTDTNTQSGDAIKMDMPPQKIEFLTVQ